jgi:hypothetical protein
LIDNLEDYEISLNGVSDIKEIIEQMIAKLKSYYIRTYGAVYTISTSKHNGLV